VDFPPSKVAAERSGRAPQKAVSSWDRSKGQVTDWIESRIGLLYERLSRRMLTLEQSTASGPVWVLNLSGNCIQRGFPAGN